MRGGYLSASVIGRSATSARCVGESTRGLFADTSARDAACRGVMRAERSGRLLKRCALWVGLPSPGSVPKPPAGGRLSCPNRARSPGLPSRALPSPVQRPSRAEAGFGPAERPAARVGRFPGSGDRIPVQSAEALQRSPGAPWSRPGSGRPGSCSGGSGSRISPGGPSIALVALGSAWSPGSPRPSTTRNNAGLFSALLPPGRR